MCVVVVFMLVCVGAINEREELSSSTLSAYISCIYYNREWNLALVIIKLFLHFELSFEICSGVEEVG